MGGWEILWASWDHQDILAFCNKYHSRLGCVLIYFQIWLRDLFSKKLQGIRVKPLLFSLLHGRSKAKSFSSWLAPYISIYLATLSLGAAFVFLFSWQWRSLFVRKFYPPTAELSDHVKPVGKCFQRDGGQSDLQRQTEFNLKLHTTNYTHSEWYWFKSNKNSYRKTKKISRTLKQEERILLH